MISFTLKTFTFPALNDFDNITFSSSRPPIPLSPVGPWNKEMEALMETHSIG